MLQTVLLLVGGVLGLLVLFVIWRVAATVLASHRRTEEILAEIRTVTDALLEGREPSTEEIRRFAASARTRNSLLEALRAHDREALFPGEYTTGEAIAESDLVFWLCHPNELQAAPDEIELVGRFSRQLEPSRRSGEYHLFRYRVKPPHWAADDGWMAGVAGPYLQGETQTLAASGTFSDFARFDSRPPAGHVDAVHQIMVEKGVYADLDDELGSS